MQPQLTISISWHIDDVLQCEPSLTKTQACEVLRLAEQNHDANVGINWDVISYWADYVTAQP